jgi:Mu-like prophage major head subunit gpT
MALTPRFVTDLETRMKTVSTQEYQRLSAVGAEAFLFAKERPSTGMREQLIWMMDTAKIEYVDKFGGTVKFEEMVANIKEYENKAATAGLKLNAYQFDDLNGGGIEQAANWARQIGHLAAYWPREQILTAVRNGELATSTTYDGQAFFSTAHPVNPFDTVTGNFANLFTGAASGVYPGACPIDASVTLDVAFTNLQKVFTYISTLKMANGVSPRMLKIKGIAGPTALMPRLLQLTNAKYIGQPGTGGLATADVEAIVRNWGLGMPYEIPELGAAYTNGSDTSYYMLIEQAGSDEVGAIGYSNREPFQIVYNGPQTDAQLARNNELQWVVRGRNATFYMHPYLLFKVKAA